MRWTPNHGLMAKNFMLRTAKRGLMLSFYNKSNHRFYNLYVYKDLLGHFTLTVSRGGHYGRCVRHFGFDCLSTIQARIQHISKARLKRGYELVKN